MKTFLSEWRAYFEKFTDKVARQIIYVILALCLGISVALTGLGLPPTSVYDVIEGRQMAILVLIVAMACVYACADLTIDFVIDKLHTKPAAQPTTPEPVKHVGA